MRLVALEDISTPAFLARNIYDEFGKIILAKGTELNKLYLKRLKELDVQSVYIENEMASLEVDDLFAEDIRKQVIKITRDSLISLRAGEAPGIIKIRNNVNDLIEEIMLNNNIMVHLMDIYSLKDHTFKHSVNVCVLSLLTGLAMEYDHEQLMKLGAGALLHDVGKTMILDQIVNKKDVMVEEEYSIIQKHPEYGHIILEKSCSICDTAAKIAYQHHERFDGTGYPRGIKGDNIFEMARIVAVADVFDAVSSDRPYRERFLPHKVVEIINEAIGTAFDPNVAKRLIANIAPFPLGSMVLLNSGEKGVIISIDQGFPARPRLQVLYDKNGDWVEGISIIDLMRDKELFIEKILKE